MREIAPGVVCVGPWGRTQTNVYLVRGATGWLRAQGWSDDDVRRLRDRLTRP